MRSTRYKKAVSGVDLKKVYPIGEAVELMKKSSTVKFDAGVEVHIHLGVDPSKSDQSVRVTMVLPHGTGKTKKVMAFVEPEKESEAKEAGADIVGGEELIAEISKSGKVDADVAVATPAMMPKIAKIAKTLGQRGLMPNPKTDTVGPAIAKLIIEQKKGKLSARNDATGNIHQIIGKVSWDAQKISENLQAFIEALRRAKPASSKGIFLKNVVLTSTMGPGIKVAV